MSTLPPAPGQIKGRHLVLWDGECGFCRRSVEWIAAQDRRRALDFKPYQSVDLAPSLQQACEKAVHVIKSDGTVLRAGRAMLFCGEFTRFKGFARIGQWPIFLPFIEVGYALVAHNRDWVSHLFFTRERPEEYDRVSE